MTRDFSAALSAIRRHGLWIFAAVASLQSLNVPALFLGVEAVKHATRFTPADLLLAILAAAAVVEIALGLRKARHALPPFGAWILFGASAVTLILVAGSPVKVAQLFAVLVVAYGWALYAPDDSRDIERALWALAAATGVHVVFALAQMATADFAFEVRGLLEHRNSFGVFMAMALPLLGAAALSGRKHIGVRIWFAVTVALGLFAVTSAGLLFAASFGLVASTAAVAMTSSRLRALPKWSHAALALALTLGVVFAQGVAAPAVREAQLRSVQTFPADEQGRRRASMRVRLWAASADAFAERPSLGWGPGNFQDAIKTFYQPPFDKPLGRGDDIAGYDVRFDEPGSQSLYAVTAVETGLLGLAALAFFLATTFGRLAGQSEHDRFGLAAGALGAVVAITLSGLFGSFFVRGLGAAFVLIVALGERSTVMD